ncbi:helix-turn-helix transcriptional regulator [Shewanella schlegeliana]|uniref:LuxR family transcriptional regulator n=1 Tax=Shewanella schlegeliana TaxID=190308 RepID=A0ABS1SZW5_9GAMM|nr:LuxR family transcriptional regulator [Shewanella schlegeliana]MBL4912831.1 LuxR family transcriptional regulator [Shewanella schlegeliana]MCL1109072.1 helix-turn-helix transcriptional regulator [Shewanella schlegeliana]GIU23133.1 helix-turn-helix transcriptional regulator [Shewanella schlegeliana]
MGQINSNAWLIDESKSDLTPLAEETLNSIKSPIAELGFGGFWFQGIANSAYQDYLGNNRKSLLTRKVLRSSGGVFASSPTVKQLHQQYVTRVAPTDINFAAALRLDSPYHYVLSEDGQSTKVQKLFNSHGINTVLSWPLKHFASDTWSGRFTLLSKYPYEELRLAELEQTLKQAQLTIFEHFHNEINPYRQYDLFNQTAIRALKMAATGLHNREISEQLDITVRGVEYHLESLRNKLSASNRANLVHIAHQLEII